MWMDPHWDSTVDAEGIFRNSSIYETWVRRNGQIKLVKLSLFRVDEENPVAQLIFSGKKSNITDWFSKHRLLSSPWFKIDPPGSLASVFTISGNQMWPGRRFLINKSSAKCSDDIGWLLAAGQEPACDWIKPFTILYSNTTKPVTWSEVSASGRRVGTADFMTIQVITE
ncbi:uncharacterized protein LOC110973408 [Acanthaster planci]|uniref:Uncharacterized protein LOC110973408 n=1 Tax=Acanthaster planci TaxID=133434 RepID=A0A8B7XIH7_ACAPL|nr:uncharacterized protein LOC110973408 [Acanthaster planci]